MAGVMVCLCCLRGFWEKKFEFPYNFPYKYDTAPGNQNGDNRRQVRVSPRGFHGLDVWVVILICNPWVQIRRSEYVLYEILVQGRCYRREDLQASSQHMKKKHGQSSDLHRLQGHQASESEVSMSNAVNLLRPDVAFELNRRIVLARVRVPLPVVRRKPAVISAPGIMCPAPCPNEIVCRDAYVCGYHRVLSAGTMSPV